MIKIEDLKQNPNNPRKIGIDALNLLKESISRDPEFMKLRPIVVDENNLVLGGNQRLRALKEMGYKEIPNEWVVVAKGLNEEQKKRFMIVDNSPEGMTGDWDQELLKELCEEIDLEALGIEIDNLIEEEFEEDDEEELFFEKSLQLEPTDEFIVIKCPANSEEWENLKDKLKLKKVRRGGYKKGSSFDQIGLERVLTWKDLLKRLGVDDVDSCSK